MRTVTNRVLLLCLGLSLTCAGLWLAVGGFAGERLPGWWRGPRPDEPPVGRGRYEDLHARGWWDAAVVGGLSVLALLLLWWLLAQVSDGSTRLLHLPRPWVRLRTRALASAVEAEVGRLESVAASRVRIGGRRDRLEVTVTVHLTPEAQPSRLLQELMAGPLENLRASTGAGDVHSVVRLRCGRRRAMRVR